MRKKIALFFALAIFFFMPALADNGKYSFNSAWMFHLGDVKGAEQISFDDTSWDVVTTPHTVKLMPAEASGNRNYQGVAWYRKHFIAPHDHSVIYFEAIMGKQKIYVNGRLAVDHFGGYLPITVHLDKLGVKKGDHCVIAVMTDNSDDSTYPPGKRQYTLDFCYHGGIYRDVWLLAKGDAFITDPIEANEVAGGGVFVHYANISDKKADVYVDVEIARRSQAADRGSYILNHVLLDKSGRIIDQKSSRVSLVAGGKAVIKHHFSVKKPNLWSPENPYLYKVVTRLMDGKKVMDEQTTRIGIRSFEFRGTDGFWLNGRKYHQFVGANRHQDFAYVGNAVPNSQQWRDAKRLKEAGFNIIRTAHYPQDPSFMDACDELGIFVIVATPGWQYWNEKEKVFEDRVLENTRQIIRRDRNHPSVLMWEPILNETPYPKDFSLKSLQITKDEYPYPYRPVAAADVNSAGVRDNYDVVYGWPGDDEKPDRPRQNILTREFGEYVDDWYAHNNLNRASRSWGERPMLIQALSLAGTTSQMHRSTGLFLGGAQWHPFDHQRGYHPDPYWGGIYDAFRQKKTAFYMFKSQAEEPMVYIAHEMSQFSDNDVVVFSNCDSVRLSMYDGSKSWTLLVRHHSYNPPFSNESPFPMCDSLYNAPVVFKGVWNFWEAREWSYKQRAWQKVNMVAEGIKGGKVVCRMEKMPSRRSTKLRLYADEMGKKLVADGSDFLVVVCEVTDDNGNVRRMAKENIRFTVSGEGEIIGDEQINANPRTVEWGSAPILVRSTRTAGTIKIHAEVQFPGTHAPTPADLEIESVPAKVEFCDGIIPDGAGKSSKVLKRTNSFASGKSITEEEKKRSLDEVMQQQAEFGIAK